MRQFQPAHSIPPEDQAMTDQRALSLSRCLAGLAILLSFAVALAVTGLSLGIAAQDKKDDKEKKIDKKEDKKEDKDDKDKKEEKKEPPKLDEPLQSLKDHKDWVNAVVFNHDGTLLATSSRDRTVKIWDLKSAKAVQTFKTQPEKTKGVPSVKSVIFLGETNRVAAPTGKW